MGRLSALEFPAADSTPKKDRLTLTQLAAYDDILTDALVDHVYFWTTIRKNRSKYNLTRGINEDDVTNILLYDVIVAKDVPKAESRLLQLPGTKKYFNNLRTDREKEDFKRHMRKYINMWLPDCPFEVSTTNRYTIFTHEAATTARRFIKSGETIKHLCGNLVAMTPEEEKDMDLTRRDFSVVLSSRKKTPSLFLGPARFSNHDCNANARLQTQGAEGMVVIAVRNIELGDEITVNYGLNYFGEDNCECLCATCESHERGGWDQTHSEDGLSRDYTPTEGLENIEDAEQVGGLKRSESQARLDSETPNGNGESPAKKRRLDVDTELATGLNTPDSSCWGSARKVKTEPQNSAHTSKTEPWAAKLLNEAKSKPAPKPKPAVRGKRGRGKGVMRGRGGAQARGKISRASTVPDMHGSLKAPPSKATTAPPQTYHSEAQKQKLLAWMLTAGTNQRKPPLTNPIFFPSITTPAINLSQASQKSTSPSENSSIFSHRHHHHHQTTPDTASSTSTSSRTITKPTHGPTNASPSLSPTPSTSSLSSVPSNLPYSDIDFSPPRQPFARVKARSSRSTLRTVSTLRYPPPKPSTPILPTIEHPPSSTSSPTPPLHRHPGDYTRTRLLLSLNHSRWVSCRTCHTTWVQANGYQTRKECPRCERHSKLYGFMWPKTENARGEREERVLDHRTVHRFICHEEEREERKRGRGVLGYVGVGGEGEEEGSGSLRAGSEMGEEGGRGRRSGKGV